MRERDRVFWGTGYAVIATIVSLIAGILLRPLIVWFIGIGEYGAFALALAILGIATLATDLGLGGALTKFVAEERDEERRRELISSAIIAAVLSGFVATLVVLEISPVVGATFRIQGIASLLAVFAWMPPFSFGANSCLAALSGLRRMRRYGFGSAAINGLGLAIVAGVLILGGKAADAALAMVLAGAANLGLLLFLLRSYLRRIGIRKIASTVRRLVSFGIHLSATNAASVLLYQIDIVLLGLLTGDSVLVGYYSIAILLARALWIFPGSIAVVAYPAFSEYAGRQTKSRIEAFANQAVRFSASIVGFSVIGFSYFGREILTILFGPASQPSYVPLLILLLGAGLLGVMRSVASGIPGVGRPALGAQIAFAGLAASVSLCLALIPPFGLLGAAIATTLAYSLIALLLARFASKLLAISVPGGWILEAIAWVLLLVSPLALATMASGSPLLRWCLGITSMVVFVAVLYYRLLPREDTDFVLAKVLTAIRRPKRDS